MKRASSVAMVTAFVITFSVSGAQAQGRGTMKPAMEQQRFERMCSGDQTPPAGPSMQDRLAKFLLLNDSQKSALKDVHEAYMKGLTDTKSICSTKPDFATVPGRMAYDETQLQARLNGIKGVREKMDAFYGSLNDEQKAKFNSGFNAAGGVE